MKLGKKKGNVVAEVVSQDNIKLIKTVLAESDDVISDIYHLVNKTVDKPNKNEISIYRKSLMNLLNSKQDEKFKYIYEIASKAVFDFKEKEEKIKVQLQNQVFISPNIFTISWSEVSDNIKKTLQDQNEISPESIKYAFVEEHKRLNELRKKINKMLELGISVPNAKDLEVTEKTFLKLTEILNIFMLENFNDVTSMMQEIEVFEKQYNINAKTPNSIFMDANYKKISNLSSPEIASDAANKAYVDSQIKMLNDKIEQLKTK